MVTIGVTEKHIERGLLEASRGETCREKWCPVALALHDAGFPEALVMEWIIQLDGTEPGGRKILNPVEVNLFVRAFDHNIPVAPFEFPIDVRYPAPSGL